MGRVQYLRNLAAVSSSLEQSGAEDSEAKGKLGPGAKALVEWHRPPWPLGEGKPSA